MQYVSYAAYFTEEPARRLKPKDRVRVHRPTGEVIACGFVKDVIGHPGHEVVMLHRDDGQTIAYNEAFYRFQLLHENKRRLS